MFPILLQFCFGLTQMFADSFIGLQLGARDSRLFARNLITVWFLPQTTRLLSDGDSVRFNHTIIHCNCSFASEAHFSRKQLKIGRTQDPLMFRRTIKQNIVVERPIHSRERCDWREMISDNAKFSLSDVIFYIYVDLCHWAHRIGITK